ncbi:hypothetical protein EYR40_010260 [Pleurotus pulmonarius]|nr:hypothetical protein EYR40_010260 [Pleurotus pulmonarius]
MAALSSTLRGLALLTLCLVSLSAGVQAFSQSDTASGDSVQSNPRVLILGGGVAGIIAARTLHQNGLENFLIIEARDEIGGRLRSHTFGNGTTIELGANWVQGTQVGHGPSNPIWDLARKHNVSTVFNDYSSITTYDGAGLVNYTNIVDDATDNLDKITELAGERVTSNLIDLNARAGYSLVGAKPQSSHAKAAEYWNFDWEYGDTPSGSSLIAAGLNNNFTFDTDQGGFSDENRLSIDQRGFKTIITEEANGFLRPSQLLLNSTVKRIKYSHSGVQVTLANGTSITGDYVLCTFSLGVLQNDDVIFDPVLPDWKMEAIQSMTMTTYTKIFLQFPHKFWFNTEARLLFSSVNQTLKPHRRWVYTPMMKEDVILSGRALTIQSFSMAQGQYSERIEALPDRQVQSEVMDILRSMFPDTNVPSPSDFFFPRWHSDPLYRGSYSNWPASFTREHHDNLRASVGVGGRERLWFAGEATSFKYFGFLHGAYTEATLLLLPSSHLPSTYPILLHHASLPSMRTPYVPWVLLGLPAFLFSSIVDGGSVPLAPRSKVATAWFAGWHADQGFPVNKINWSQYTEMAYSFAIVTKDGGLSLEGSNPDVLPSFVKQARNNNVRPLIAIGGWTGSRYFSTAVANAQGRKAFVKAVVNFVKKYNLDGVDFDWEYPGRQGIGCNTISPSDTRNFLAFLQELRRDPSAKNMVLSAAVSITPFASADSSPSTDVSGFSRVLDYIAIMNYDIWGSWSPTVGPNAPLFDSCAAQGNQAGSATSAIVAWSTAGMPLNQIVLGVPAYGHSFRVRRAQAFESGSTTQLAAYPPFDKSQPPTGDKWDDPAGVDECGNTSGPGGNFNFWGIVQAKLLNADGTPKPGVPYRFDSCSQTSYVYDTANEVMISFDDKRSFQMKGMFIKMRQLRGFAMWEAGGDFNDVLVKTLRDSAGF